MPGMRRREFVSLFGGVAATWPLAARAQQPALPVIGFLSTRSSGESAYLTDAFRRGLAEGGYVEGQHVTVEYRWVEGDYDRLPAMAMELARHPVAALVAVGGDASALAARSATATIPIVFVAGTDPVKLGLVTSYNRPGGNLTGINLLTNTLEPKRLGLLRELVPQSRTLGVLLNPNNPPAGRQWSDLETAARAIGLEPQVWRASTDGEIVTSFDDMAQQRISALVVAADPFFNTRRDKLVALTARLALPAMYQFREYPVAGGLMSYGVDVADVYRQAGVYAGRILKGARPADLPVLQPTKFEFVVNLKTARALGIKVSDNLLSLADEVIE
jgi:putative ABC transport system substrate-binding protein